MIRRAMAAAVAAFVLAMLAGCIPAPESAPAGPLNGPGAGGGSARSAGKPLLPAYQTTRLLDPGTARDLGVEGNGAPGSLTPAARFAAGVGRRPDIVGQYLAWKSPFPADAVTREWAYGALAYFAWEPYGTTVHAIAAGRSDGYLSAFAQAVRTLNLPVAISFGQEMNGFWYPWGTRATSPADFVAAWRRIHRLFAAAGATNVIWVWNPNVIFPVPQVRLRPYYPGDAYVGWVGVTGYFATTGPQSYTTLYQPTFTEIRAFTRRPFLIAETSIESGPGEVACAHQLLATVRHRGVLGLIWFDYNKNGVDWRAESRPILRAALSREIAALPLARVN